MISYTASAAWSHSVLLLCYTKHDPSYGVVLLSHITTVAISKSGQLGRRCTIEPHYNVLHVLQTFQ
jgi:hypothetical protein